MSLTKISHMPIFSVDSPIIGMTNLAYTSINGNILMT